MDSQPKINVRHFHASSTLALACKRSLDLFAAIVGLVVLSPVMLVVAAAIWLSMGRPVLFRQPRPGLAERPFNLIKFRTLLPPETPDGRTLSPEERLTRLGWLLRRTSLDELPQLWNVLMGDLSLVGPRPLLVDYLPWYTERERLRHTVRPGITGLAQVTGRNNVTWDEKLALDVQYVEKWSLWLDLKILGRSVGSVLRTSGVARNPLHEGGLHQRGQNGATSRLAVAEAPAGEPTVAEELSSRYSLELATEATP